MDELTMLKSFRESEPDSGVARERAEKMLRARIARSRSNRRMLVALVAFGALVVLAASAYGVHARFLAGDEAPPDVKRQVALLDQVKGTLFKMRAQGLEVDRTRAAAVIVASTGPVYLWTTPTRDGRLCAFVQIVGTERRPRGRPNLGGGCGGWLRPVGATFSRTFVRGGRYLLLVYGRVDPDAVSIEIRSPAGVKRVAPTGRWFLTEVRAEPTIVVAFDRQGRRLGAQRFGPASPRPQTPTGRPKGTAVAQILTRRTRKPIRLSVTRYAGGETCATLTTPGGVGHGCGRAPLPRTLPISVTQIGPVPKGLVLLAGEVGSGIATVDIRFEDGRRERLDVHDRLILYQVARSDVVPGRRPVELIGRDVAGAIVARRSLRPRR